MKKRKVLASDEDLINGVDSADKDTWNGYHGRRKLTRPKKKLYFKIHEESFD